MYTASLPMLLSKQTMNNVVKEQSLLLLLDTALMHIKINVKDTSVNIASYNNIIIINDL